MVRTPIVWIAAFSLAFAPAVAADRDGVEIFASPVVPVDPEISGLGPDVRPTPPEMARAAYLDDLARVAQAHMDPRHTRIFSTARTFVVADAQRPDVAQTIAINLEGTLFILENLLGERIDVRPTRYKLVAYVFERREAFERLKEDVGIQSWASGSYHTAGMVVFHLEMPTAESLLRLVLHEAAHAFLDRHVVDPGIRLPIWMDEGFAEYIGNSTIRKGELVPGKTPKGQIYPAPYGRRRLGWSEPRLTLRETRNAVRRGKAPTLEETVLAGPPEFYGEDRSLYYSMSWLVVHFLRHGEEDWAGGEFPLLLGLLAQGRPVEAAFREAYGVEPAAMNDTFHRYVKKF